MTETKSDSDQSAKSDEIPDSGRNREVPAESSEMARAFWSSMRREQEQLQVEPVDSGLIQGCFGPTLEETEEILTEEERAKQAKAKEKIDAALDEMSAINKRAQDACDRSAATARSLRIHGVTHTHYEKRRKR